MKRRIPHSPLLGLFLLGACGDSTDSRDAIPRASDDDLPDSGVDSTEAEVDDDLEATGDVVDMPSSGPVGAGGDAGSGTDPATPGDVSSGDASSGDAGGASSGDAGDAMPGASSGPPDAGDGGSSAPSDCTDPFVLMPEAPTDLATASQNSARLLPLRDGRVVGFGSYTSLAAIYDPDRNEWTNVPENPVSMWVSDVNVIGDLVVVWPYGGDAGAIFDVASNSWLAGSPSPIPEPLTSEGGEVVAGQYVRFVSNFGEVEFETGFRFDPVQNAWFEIGGSGPPFQRLGFVSVASDRGLLVWGGAERLTGDVGDVTELPLLGDGARLDSESWTWLPMSTDGAPSPRSTPVAVWTGEELIIYGGFARAERSSGVDEPLNDGYRYNPTTDTWAPLGASGPVLPWPGSAAWTGKQLLVWSQSEDQTGWVGGAYDPETMSWTDLQFPAGFPVMQSVIHTTTDGQVVVFPKSGPLPSTVFVYEGNDTGWRAFPIDVDVEPRGSVAPVWVNDRLILWGGYTSFEPPDQCVDVPDDQGCDPLVEFTSVLDGVVFRPCPG